MCVFARTAQFWDWSLVNNRIETDFNGDQDSYISYLVDQINGPWKAQVAGASVVPLSVLGGFVCTHVCVVRVPVPSLHVMRECDRVDVVRDSWIFGVCAGLGQREC